MRNERGITLIALIITIIILVILSAVSTAIITESNIINYAKKGAGDYQTREDEELEMLGQAEEFMMEVLGGSTSGTNPGESRRKYGRNNGSRDIRYKYST